MGPALREWKGGVGCGGIQGWGGGLRAVKEKTLFVPGTLVWRSGGGTRRRRNQGFLGQKQGLGDWGLAAKLGNPTRGIAPLSREGVMGI